MTKIGKLREMPKGELIQLIEKCNSLAELSEALGFQRHSSPHVRKVLDARGIDYSKLVQRGRNVRMCNLGLLSLDEVRTKTFEQYPDTNNVFCKGDKRRNGIRGIVLRNNLIEYKCVHCGNTGEWMGKPLTLTLDHANGDPTDNRLENLRFVCPNCDTQQDTYGYKNAKFQERFAHSESRNTFCIICGKKIYRHATYCKECYEKIRTKIPSKNDLLAILVENKWNKTETGKYFDVTPTTIRRWIKKYNLKK